MTQPQPDPLESSAALARLTEQVAGLHQEISALERLVHTRIRAERELTDATFVRLETVVKGEAEKVKLALTATETAIGKAEVATGKAIEKAEIANDKRFESVNEFRSQQTDLIARFATLERVDLLYTQARQRLEEVSAVLTDRSVELGTRLTTVEALARGAQASKAAIIATIGIGVTLIIGAVALFNAIFK